MTSNRNSIDPSTSAVRDSVDAAGLVVRDVERPVRPLCQSRRTMLRRVGLHDSTRETVGEGLEVPRGFAGRERLKDDLIAALRTRRTIPGSVKRDERAVAVARREGGPGVEQQSIGRPVRREECRGCLLGGALPDRLAAIAAVLRREHELLLLIVEVALGPAEVVALVDLEQLLGGEVLALLSGVELGPVVPQLISSMLGRPQVPIRPDSDADSVADARCVTRGRGECLPRLVRVERPDPAAGLQLRAGLVARRIRNAVLELARIARRAEVDVHRA